MKLAQGWLALLLVAIVMPASAAPGHVHGKGELGMVVVGDRLTLTLELPLDALAGFERAPRSDKEKAAWRAMAQALDDPAALFQPSPAAACTIVEKRVQLPFGGGAAATAGHNDDHADADIEYIFRCAKPAALNKLTTRMFERFPRLYRLDVKRSGPAGQGAARLTPKQPSIAW